MVPRCELSEIAAKPHELRVKIASKPQRVGPASAKEAEGPTTQQARIFKFLIEYLVIIVSHTSIGKLFLEVDLRVGYRERQ